MMSSIFIWHRALDKAKFARGQSYWSLKRRIAEGGPECPRSLVLHSKRYDSLTNVTLRIPKLPNSARIVLSALWRASFKIPISRASDSIS